MCVFVLVCFVLLLVVGCFPCVVVRRRVLNVVCVVCVCVSSVCSVSLLRIVVVGWRSVLLYAVWRLACLLALLCAVCCSVCLLFGVLVGALWLFVVGLRSLLLVDCCWLCVCVWCVACCCCLLLLVSCGCSGVCGCP